MVADAWVWWLVLAAGVPLTAAPLLLTVRRAGRRRVPLFGSGPARPPWWAAVALLVGLVLLNYASRGLAGDDDGGLAYFVGPSAVSLVLQLGVVVLHNGHAARHAGVERIEVRGRRP